MSVVSTKKELFCPVTGLRVIRRPAWTKVRTSPKFVADFSVIGEHIIYSKPEGKADIDGTKGSLALNDAVLNDFPDNATPYVQIEDYSQMHSSSQSARRYFALHIDNNSRLIALIFCNLTPVMSAAVKIGNRVTNTTKPIHVVKHYDDAVRLAIDICKEHNLADESFVFDKPTTFIPKAKSLTSIETFSDDSWTIENTEYTQHSILIDKTILHSTTQGNLTTRHIPLIDKMVSEVSDKTKIEYIIVDSSRMKSGKQPGRVAFVQFMKDKFRDKSLKMYIAFGANRFIKTAIFLARPLMPFRIKIARDLNHAFEIIHMDKQSEHDHQTDDICPALPTQENIDNLIAFMGSLNWTDAGIDSKFEVPADHPFYYLYQSLKLIKEEVDDLFIDRDNYNHQKIDALSRMAGAIAHNFNNQLTVILGNLDLAKGVVSTKDKVLLDILNQAIIAANRSSKISQQMLFYLGHNQGPFKQIDLATICHQLLPLCQEDLPSHITINTDRCSEGAFIMGNATHMRQFGINLIDNAKEALGDCPGTISLATHTVKLTDLLQYQLTPKDWLPNAEVYSCLEVTDNGEGMTPDTMNQIFDPFFTTRFTGRGLGLAVVYGALKSLDGAVSVESKPGNGSTFRFFFPFKTEPETPPIFSDIS